MLKIEQGKQAEGIKEEFNPERYCEEMERIGWRFLDTHTPDEGLMMAFDTDIPVDHPVWPQAWNNLEWMRAIRTVIRVQHRRFLTHRCACDTWDYT